MQSTEIGQFSLEINNKRFNLIPSLENMAKLADSKRLIVIYEMIHSNIVPSWNRINLAYEILTTCSDQKDIAKHLNKKESHEFVSKCKGYTTKKKKGLFGFFRQTENNDKISINDQVIVAAALMRHGVAGVNRPEFEGSKKNNKAATEFDVNKITADAMIHFGLSKTEAMQLTMSEFCHLLASKYPKETKAGDAPSMDDHKAAMKAFMEQENGK